MHPGHTVEEVIEHTGFDFDRPATVPQTPAPSPETLHLMREVVAPQLAEVYPQFAAQVFGASREAAFGALKCTRPGAVHADSPCGVTSG